MECLNGELTTVCAQLTTAHSEAVRSTDIRDFQQLMTNSAQRFEEAKLNSDISVLVHQYLAYCIRFVVFGAVRIGTLNTAAVFEDVVDRWNGIPEIMAGSNVMGTVIDEEASREVEGNHIILTLFAEGERRSDFHVTLAQPNKLVYIFENASTTRDALNVAKAARFNESLAS